MHAPPGYSSFYTTHARPIGSQECGARRWKNLPNALGREDVRMELHAVAVENPQSLNLIFGHSHFIKTVEDLHEALVGTVPGIRFGLAFCEASGPRLVRTSGTDPALVDLAGRNAVAVGCGHTFFIFLGNAYPVNVLGAVRQIPEVCQIYCATANPVEVIVAATGAGRAVLGVVDGQAPLGIEGPDDAQARHDLLRRIGYKL